MRRIEAARGFSIEGYRALLQCLGELGYDFVFIDEIENDQPHVFLRHDVDLCLERAAQLANVEREEGVKSTYYVLLNTEFYNPFSCEGRGAIRDILSCGHRIGLHFDAAHYPDHPDTLSEAAARECDLLEKVVEAPIDSISFHRPTRSLQGRVGTIAGRAHAYEPRFFNVLPYYTDSQGAWRFGHPLDDARVQAGKAMQLVTHPIWWVEEGTGVIDKLEGFRKCKGGRLCEKMAGNLKPFADFYGPSGDKAPPI